MTTLSEITTELTDITDRIDSAQADGLGEWATAWQYPGGVAQMAIDLIAGRAEAATMKKRVSNNAPALVRVIERLWLRQIPNHMIAELLELPPSMIEEYLTRTSRAAEGDQLVAGQRVWALHCKGSTVYEIRDVVGVSRSLIYRILDHEEATPKRHVRAAPNQRETDQLIKLYQAGHAYSEMVKRTGMSMASVKRALKRAHDDGKLPEYGTRGGGRPPKETVDA